VGRKLPLAVVDIERQFSPKPTLKNKGSEAIFGQKRSLAKHKKTPAQ